MRLMILFYAIGLPTVLIGNGRPTPSEYTSYRVSKQDKKGMQDDKGGKKASPSGESGTPEEQRKPKKRKE